MLVQSLGTSKPQTRSPLCPELTGRYDIIIIFLSVLLSHLDCMLLNAMKQRNITDNDEIIHSQPWESRAHPGRLKYPLNSSWMKTSGWHLQQDADRKMRRQWGSCCWMYWINGKPVWIKMADSGAQRRKHHISWLQLFRASLAFACDNTAPYTSYRNPCWPIHSIFTAAFDSNDFIKPLILAWSAWLQHRRVPLLISDSISREPCAAVAADTNMPSTLKSAGNLFPPQCSSSRCNSHSDKPPSLWYLETKWEEGWGEEGITYFVIGIRREIVVTRQV